METQKQLNHPNCIAYQRLPSTKQPSYNSSNIIIFQTIYPLEQKLDGRQQADRLHRKAVIIPLRCQRGSIIEQPTWNSSNIIIFQTIYSLEQELDGRQQADSLHRKAEFYSIKKSKRVQHLTAILEFYKQYLLPNHISSGA